MDYISRLWENLLLVSGVLFSGIGVFFLQLLISKEFFKKLKKKFFRSAATRQSLKRSIEPYFIENDVIFRTYGPMTDERYNPESESSSIWQRKIQKFILPNNKKIVDLIERDIHLLEDWELEIFMRYKQHVNDFSAKHSGGTNLSSGEMFPIKIRDILE